MRRTRNSLWYNVSGCDNFCSSLKYSDSRRTLAEWSMPWKKAWSNLQQHYLGKAKVPFCTARTGARTVLRSFDSVTSSNSDDQRQFFIVWKTHPYPKRYSNACPIQNGTRHCTSLWSTISMCIFGHSWVLLQWYHRVHFILVGITKTLRLVLW